MLPARVFSWKESITLYEIRRIQKIWKQFYINKGWYFVPIVCKNTEKEHGLCEDRGREWEFNIKFHTIKSLQRKNKKVKTKLTSEQKVWRKTAIMKKGSITRFSFPSRVRLFLRLLKRTKIKCRTCRADSFTLSPDRSNYKVKPGVHNKSTIINHNGALHAEHLRERRNPLKDGFYCASIRGSEFHR